MFACLVHRLSAPAQALAQFLHRRLHVATKPAAAPLVVGTLADVARSRSDLLIENALLRHQVITLRRSVKRPRCTAPDGTVKVAERCDRMRLYEEGRTWRHRPQRRLITDIASPVLAE